MAHFYEGVKELRTLVTEGFAELRTITQQQAENARIQDESVRELVELVRELYLRGNSRGGGLDELQTFVGSKKNKIWIWTAINHFKPGILEWVVGDHSAKTFEPLWAIVSLWKCFFYITEGLKVYPNYIPDGDQIVCKTYMTRVEGENTRLRPYLDR